MKSFALGVVAAVSLLACSDPSPTTVYTTPPRPPPPPTSGPNAAPAPKPRPTTGVEGQFTTFMKDNDALVAAINEAAKSGPAAARKVFDERKDALKKTFDGIKDLRSDAVKEDTVLEFTNNVTHAISEICWLGMGSGADSAAFQQLCLDYRQLLTL